MTYSQKLKDPRWQKKRLEILERDNWTCKCCSGKKETLHVHHISYNWSKDPWDYDEKNFIILCGFCHELWHKIDKLNKLEFETLVNTLIENEQEVSEYLQKAALIDSVSLSKKVNGIIENWNPSSAEKRDFITKYLLSLGQFVKI